MLTTIAVIQKPPVLLKRDTTIGQMVESADSVSKGGVAKPARSLAIA